ncbi:MAG TPA: TadE family protein [Actinomycetota bacterium]|nr:TadE family protein [Actinomycetota bacterium]
MGEAVGQAGRLLRSDLRQVGEFRGSREFACSIGPAAGPALRASARSQFDRGRSRALRALRPPNPPRKQLRDCFPTSARERATADHGQATIEAALTLPVVLIALLLIVQVGLVVRDALALVQAAREGARAAAVSGNDDDARAAIRRSAGPLDADEIEIEVQPEQRERGSPITINLRYIDRLRIPIVSRILSLELPLRASATMRLEREVPTPSAGPGP